MSEVDGNSGGFRWILLLLACCVGFWVFVGWVCYHFGG